MASSSNVVLHVIAMRQAHTGTQCGLRLVHSATSNKFHVDLGERDAWKLRTCLHQQLKTWHYINMVSYTPALEAPVCKTHGSLECFHTVLAV